MAFWVATVVASPMQAACVEKWICEIFYSIEAPRMVAKVSWYLLLIQHYKIIAFYESYERASAAAPYLLVSDAARY